MTDSRRTKTIILGAAGRDFHDFNVYWKKQSDVEIVGFTATQIPDIDGRVYPPQLAGEHYPNGIPIYPEDNLEQLIAEHGVTQVTMAYSDVSHQHVMHLASRSQAAGASFRLLGSQQTMVPSSRPIIAICAVRTGSGKSQTTRRISEILKQMDKKVAVVRHPMPYGDLTRQICQRFAAVEDLDREDCTIEEREEYEPHIELGNVVFAGIDYEQILRRAEEEADVVLWDGGNNDLPFYVPSLHVVVADPHRLGHETRYYPGESNLRMADLVVINKVDTAEEGSVAQLERNIRAVNPRAAVIRADSPITVAEPDAVRGKRVLVIEDGPTLTHGEMAFGAGHVAAHRLGAAEIVDPRPYAQGSLKDVFAKYGQITEILPAMGYGAKQVSELEETIRQTPCDLVLVATPIDLGRILEIDKPSQRVRYSLQEHDPGVFEKAIAKAVG